MTAVAQTLERAIAHHKSGDLDQAEGLYREVIRVDPRHSDALHLLGLAAHQRKQHDAAIEHLTQAIAANSDVAPYHCNLGAAYRAAGDFENARRCLQQALLIAPDYADALFNLGTLCFDVGSYDEARDCFERGLEINPGFVPALLRLAAIHRSRRDLQSAIRLYRQAIHTQPQLPTAHLHLAAALNEDGQLDEAAACYRTARQLNPELARIQTHPVRMLNRLVDLADAASTAEPVSSGSESSQASPASLQVAIQAHDRFAKRLTAYRQSVESSRRAESVLDHLVQAIHRAPLETDPFDHAYFENLLPADFYRELLDSLPNSEHYEELRHYDAILPNGRSARLKFRLEEQNILRLPEPLREFWLAYAPVFHSDRLKFAIFDKLCRKFDVRREVSLIRDLAGYKILPHPDIPEKKVTAQFYLPRDDSRPHLGTCLYKPDGDAFVKVNQFQFKANSGYSFTVSESSWHGVEETTLADGPRDSLMFVFFQP